MERAFPNRKLVKVYVEARRTARCKWCGEPVVWLRTVNPPERFMLFPLSARPLMTGVLPNTGIAVEYYDRAACHWDTCVGELQEA